MQNKNHKIGDLVRVVMTDQLYDARATPNDCTFDGPKDKYRSYWQYTAKFIRLLERPVAEFQVTGRVRHHPQIEVVSAYALPTTKLMN
jgi:hypothetical protein